MRYLLSSNQDKPIPPNSELREIDREDLFKKLIMYGMETVKIEADDQKIVAFFLAEEVEKFENAYLSNRNIEVPLMRVIYANELWRDLMTLWKSKMRQVQAAATNG